MQPGVVGGGEREVRRENRQQLNLGAFRSNEKPQFGRDGRRQKAARRGSPTANLAVAADKTIRRTSLPAPAYMKPVTGTQQIFKDLQYS
jgi:hypothetical protein